jgi:hypothetical protein
MLLYIIKKQVKVCNFSSPAAEKLQTKTGNTPKFLLSQKFRGKNSIFSRYILKIRREVDSLAE